MNDSLVSIPAMSASFAVFALGGLSGTSGGGVVVGASVLVLTCSGCSFAMVAVARKMGVGAVLRFI